MKVLLGVSGGERAGAAIDRAVERAREAGDTLTVAVLAAAAGAESESLVDRATAAIAEAGVDGSVRRVEGDPGSRLVQIAEEEGYDRLALADGEQSPMGKIEVGTTAEYVLLNSHVTVTLLR
ncbi:MAG: universal stress protein [Halobacteriaceae archaeon]